MEIFIDFDGTCVTHEFPLVGKDIGAIPVLRRILKNGHNIILFTMRSDIAKATSDDYNIHSKGGKYLTAALRWFKKNKIKIYGINTNPTQNTWTKSPKAYGQLYIDDAALGCPLLYDKYMSDRPFVDWVAVERMLEEKGILLKELK